MSNKKDDNASDNLVFVAQRPWLNVNEFCMYTGYKRSYVYKMVHDRTVPYHKRPRGKFLFFDKDEVDAWMMENRMATKDELSSYAAGYVAKNCIR